MKKIFVQAKSEAGRKSPENEDHIQLPDQGQEVIEKGQLFVLCDGMGGYNAGEIASDLCSKWLMEDFYNSDIEIKIEDWLHSKLEEINKRIYKKSLEDESLSKMGTTIVNLLIKDCNAYINNIGDSRVYLFSEDTLTQITEDHTVIWELYKKDLLAKDDFISDPRKNLLTHALGLNLNTNINSYKIELPAKYVFLMCSDGLTDVTLDQQIEQIIKESDNLKKCSEELYEISQINKSRDDVSIILISNYFE